LKAVAWIHACFLMLVPTVALLGVGLAYEGVRGALIAGFTPMIVYVAFVAYYYELSTRPLRALVVVGLVPLQVGLAVWHIEGGFWLFFIESAFVELTGLSLALAVAMLLYRPSGWAGAVLGVVMAACAVWGFGRPLWEPYSALGWGWWAQLGAATLSASWTSFLFVLPAAKGAGVEGSGERPLVVRITDTLFGPPGRTVKLHFSFEGTPVIVAVGLWVVVGCVAMALAFA